MKLTITSIELRSPFKFFPLSLYALKIVNQLKTTDCVEFKKKGIWTKHYTMTLWKNEEQLKNFYTSGAHLDAMKEGATIAKEIRTLTIEAAATLNWKEAITLLDQKGKSLKYK